MAKYKEPNVDQLRFVPVNFAELFPEDHPLTQLLAAIRKLDLGKFYAGYKNDTAAGGRPADSSERILAVIVYSLLYGGISMRILQRELAVRADLLYLSGGMNIDHTTFCVFRKRRHEAILKLFSQTVFVGTQAGFIDLDTVCIDSTKIRAWAGRRDIGDREQLARRYQVFLASSICLKTRSASLRPFMRRFFPALIETNLSRRPLMAGFLQKPYQRDALNETLRKVMA